MRYFRRLPPLLRVVSIVGLLLALAAVALLIINSVAHLYGRGEPTSSRDMVIAVNLTLLSLACSAAVNAYSVRFRRADRGPFPPFSWQRQLRAIALLAALPLCAIALALIIPPTSLAFAVVFPVSLTAAVVLIAVGIAGLANGTLA